MSIVLTDENLNTYTFPATFTVKDLGWKKKIRNIPIAFRDGGDEIGDKKLDSRIITIEGIVSDNATYAATMATINSWLYKTNLKLSITAGKHYNVKSIESAGNPFFDGGFFRVSKLKFNCIVADPFYYADALTTSANIIVASPTIFVVTTTSLFDILPVFEIINSVNNVTFNLENATDVGNYFNYTDAAFLAGNTLVVDSKAGTVKKDGINSIQYFSGNWLRLLPGANSFVYTGAACTLNVKYYNLEL